MQIDEAAAAAKNTAQKAAPSKKNKRALTDSNRQTAKSALGRKVHRPKTGVGRKVLFKQHTSASLIKSFPPISTSKNGSFSHHPGVALTSHCAKKDKSASDLRPGQHFHQHARYRLMAVGRHRRGSASALATAAVLLGIKLCGIQSVTCLTLVCVGRIILLEPITPAFAETPILVLL
jgi:hypothetical protein